LTLKEAWAPIAPHRNRTTVLREKGWNVSEFKVRDLVVYFEGECHEVTFGPTYPCVAAGTQPRCDYSGTILGNLTYDAARDGVCAPSVPKKLEDVPEGKLREEIRETLRQALDKLK
jgi:hypothetical protein